jgi:hypothetical protein
MTATTTTRPPPDACTGEDLATIGQFIEATQGRGVDRFDAVRAIPAIERWLAATASHLTPAESVAMLIMACGVDGAVAVDDDDRVIVAESIRIDG